MEHIVQLLEVSFNGTPWYGTSVMDQLKVMDHKVVNATVQGCNSIAACVQHIIQWRVLVIEKLKGNVPFNIEMNTKEDWPMLEVEGAIGWKKLLGRLQETQDEIVHLLSDKGATFLDTIVVGKSYDYRTLINGMVQHDVYHLGQVGLIYSQLKRAL